MTFIKNITTGRLCKILTMTVKYIHMPMKPGAQDIHVSMHLSGPNTKEQTQSLSSP